MTWGRGGEGRRAAAGLGKAAAALPCAGRKGAGGPAGARLGFGPAGVARFFLNMFREK